MNTNTTMNAENHAVGQSRSTVGLDNSTNEVTKPECTYCGNELRDPHEIANPPTDEDGDIICDECYRDRYEEICERCGEYAQKTDMDTSKGSLIAVWTEAPGRPDDLAPGYYRVNAWPLYADGMIEGYMFSGNIERVADLDDKGERAAQNAWVNCGPLCSECRGKIEETLKVPNAPHEGPGAASSRTIPLDAVVGRQTQGRKP